MATATAGNNAPKPMPVGNLMSLNPDDFAQGMLDDFEAEVIKSRYRPWVYPGKSKYSLFATWWVKTADGTVHELNWPCSWMDQNYATNDGPDVKPEDATIAGTDWDTYQELAAGESKLTEEEMAGGDYEGLYTRGTGLRQDTDWHRVTSALRDLGFSAPTPSMDCFEGLTLHFNRIPSPQRAGKKGEAEGAGAEKPKQYYFLCPTKIISQPGKGGAKAKAAAASKPAAPATTTKAATTSAPAPASEGSDSGADEHLQSVAAAVSRLVREHNLTQKSQIMPKLVLDPDWKAVPATKRKAVSTAITDGSIWDLISDVVYDPSDESLTVL